jgi:N-acetylmuramoyl-L-alanine amidase
MKKLIQIICVVFLFTATLQARYFKTVIIDPGHGGHDKGCIWGKVYEKHMCLDTSMRLEQALRNKGFSTILTRRSDYFISLPQRVAIASRYKNAIFISIHYNFTDRKDACGIETFYNTSQSQTLATHVHNKILRNVRSYNRGVKTARFYVIRNNQMPAILVECGFVSNEDERTKMCKAKYRQGLANAIAEGVAAFRNQ